MFLANLMLQDAGWLKGVRLWHVFTVCALVYFG